MDQGTRRGAGKEVADHHMAVLGDKHVVEDQRFAAGAEEAEHLPIIDDLGLGERHQEIGGSGLGYRVTPSSSAVNAPTVASW